MIRCPVCKAEVRWRWGDFTAPDPNRRFIAESCEHLRATSGYALNASAVELCLESSDAWTYPPGWDWPSKYTSDYACPACGVYPVWRWVCQAPDGSPVWSVEGCEHLVLLGGCCSNYGTEREEVEQAIRAVSSWKF